jgi:hypothetical protein
LLGAIGRFSFVEATTDEDGKTRMKVVSKENKDEYKAVAANLKADFEKIIMKKKFQVSKERLTNDTSPFVSPINGVTYPSYFAFLTSEDALGTPREGSVGSNAILAVDVSKNEHGHVFYDVGLSLNNLGTIEGDATTQRELDANSIPFPKPTAAPATDAKADVEAKRKTLGLQTVKGLFEPTQGAAYFRIILKGDNFDVLAFYEKGQWSIFPKQPNGEFQASDPKTGNALILSPEKRKEVVEKYAPKELIDLLEAADKVKGVTEQDKFMEGNIKNYLNLYRKENLEYQLDQAKQNLEVYKSPNYPNKDSQEKIVKAQEEDIARLEKELAALGQSAPAPTQPTAAPVSESEILEVPSGPMEGSGIFAFMQPTAQPVVVPSSPLDEGAKQGSITDLGDFMSRFKVPEGFNPGVSVNDIAPNVQDAIGEEINQKCKGE